VSKSESIASEGQPTHVPAVRVRGIQTGSAEYNEIVDTYRKQLNAFHMKQQQQVQLSGQRQYKARLSLPGASMIYQNNEGQETITLEIAPVAQGNPKEAPLVDEYFSWALVEFEVPGIASRETSYDMLALLTSTFKGQAVYARGSDYTTDKILRFAESYRGGRFVENNPGDVSRSSLLVDMRKFDHPGNISVDIYAAVNALTVQNPDPGPIYTPMQCFISAVLLRDNPYDTIAQFSDPRTVSFYQWEVSATYPNRPAMGVAPTPADMQAIIFPYPGGVGATIDNRFGLPKFGTLTLTPAIASAGFNFKSA
jgi:hypothetical protein